MSRPRAGKARRKDPAVFRVALPGFGEVRLRPFVVEADAGFLHDWVNRDYAFFWGLQGASLAKVEEEYRRLLAPEHYEVFVGEFEGRPAFVLERYDPRQDLIAAHYPVQPGDRGIHVIVAPPTGRKIPNFTWHLFEAILEFVFADPAAERALVEPDIRNKKMFTLCERVGFETERVVELPHKTAQLAFVTRARHLEIRAAGEPQKRSAMNQADNVVSPQQSVRHLSRERWERANRALVRKAICEFTHERLLEPRVVEPLASGRSRYELRSAAGEAYTFVAKRLPLDHLSIEAASIRTLAEPSAPVDALRFIEAFRAELGISDKLMPLYLEEILSTLQGSAFKLAKQNPSARELVDADFQTIEQSMTEGHPCFVANNGRIGFDSADYRSYAPEAGNSFALMWLAGHRRRAVYAGTEDLPYETLIARELDADTRAAFAERIIAAGRDPADYLFMPIHPWQWFNKLTSVFASEIAYGDLICLGYGPDQYLAQQSVRTMFNVSQPEKFYVKSALSILNMGFMRGLPLYYLGTAPKMAVWLEQLLYSDPYIEETGFRMLGEIASVSYVNPYFERFGPHDDFNKMLAALWRESPTSVMQEGQQAMTMAALLHVDDEGEALLPAMIAASGLSTEDWLARYFEAYLAPLLHCFYRYDLVFMPHGENLILVMDGHVPVRALLKDITEEAAILSPEVELPEGLERMHFEVPEDVKALSIFIDIFDDFFRLMAAVLEETAEFAAEDFWAAVARSVRAYQARFPELGEKFARYDLFAPSFTLSCLNRLQIRNHRQMIDLDEPVAKLQFAGQIANPLADFR
ncbi:GNAT family N-acetyltransferase [Pseudenhygromyxa sp. WMMC2535]|uniref:GNAT family N-acetyltransferase n=1 Tax=Pseudenhygromyxa sp. WMMC2535 TaxID=2712867 RepID=UPI0015548698|nr:GNAT family N-acetyltransferase [Pseudenhygromyxa sp. WMMC2535]NVB36591.1 GNAT family N-acetyltransferase [Pseudenhygromyxa sp. WMMC2535]